MAKWYATFGQGQTLKDNFVCLEAEDYKEAFDTMCKHYGSLWAFLYTAGAFAEQPVKYHLEEVELGVPNQRWCEHLAADDHTLLISDLPRNDGHSALRVKGGKLEKFDPHPETSISKDNGPSCEQDHPEGYTDPLGLKPEVETVLELRNAWRVLSTVSGKVMMHKLPVHDLTPLEALTLAAWLVVQANSVKKPGTLEYGEIFQNVERLYSQGNGN